MIIWWLFDDYLMIIWWLFDDYLMIIWWLFDDYLHYLHYLHYLIYRNISSIQKWAKLTTHPFRFCQAVLPQNTSGQVCTTGKGNLWFAWLLAARRPLWFWMSAVSIVQMQGWELAITFIAFVIQESLCLLACAWLIWRASSISASAMHHIQQAGCHSPPLL